MANQKVSQEAILKEWRTWPQKSISPTYEEKMNFYLWLETQRPDLLKFRVSSGGDKWQTVQAWLNEYEQKEDK